MNTVRPLMVPKIFLRERHRRVADRHRAFAQPCFAPHALAGAEGGVEQPIDQRAGGAPIGRRAL